MIDINDVFVQCGICRDALDSEVKNEDLILVWPCDRCSEREYGQWAQKRIAAIEAENKRLRQALESIVECYLGDDETGYVAANMYEAANAVLAGNEK